MKKIFLILSVVDSWIVDAYNEIQYDDPTNSLPSGYNLNYYNNIQYCEIWH